MADPTCWLAQFADTPCEGALVRAHVLQKQWLRQEFPEGAVWLPEQRVAVSALALLSAGVVWDNTAREMTLEELQWHPALWRFACGGRMGPDGHHGAWDRYDLLVPRSCVSRRTLTFIASLGLTAKWMRDRRFSDG